jgi:hypothetical protein
MYINIAHRNIRLILPFPATLLSCIALAIAVSGCDQRTHPLPNASAPVQPSMQFATPAAWKAALTEVYTTSSKSENYAHTRFLSHLTAASKADQLVAYALHDPFRKVWIFHAAPPFMPFTTVNTYVSIPEQGRPIVFLRPVYRSTAKPLLLKKLSMVVNGELVFESNCGAVRRDVDDRGVTEFCDIPLSERQLDVLRSITSPTKVQLRLTGSEDYAHVKASVDEVFRPLHDFKEGIRTTVAYHDRLSSAVAPYVPSTMPEALPPDADAIERLAMPRTW